MSRDTVFEPRSGESSLLPVRGLKQQIAIGIALALLLVCTRGVHPLRIEALPSATVGVFFMAGLFLGYKRVFVGLFCLAAAVDLGCLAAGTITNWCISPAYWVLVPAYGALWLGGRLCARAFALNLKGVAMLVVAMAVTELVAYTISAGGFRLWSGRYPDPTFAEFAAGFWSHYLHWLVPMQIYVGAGVAVYAVVRWFRSHHPHAQVSGA